MPVLSGSGNIFELAGSAGFDEGIIAIGGDGQVRAKWKFHLDACHGLDAAASLQILAQAAAELKLLWLLKGNAQGSAYAGIGAGLQVKADINPFNIMGFSARIAGSLELSAAGRISAGITLEEVARLGKQYIESDYLYDIFIAFLNEVDISWGVSGSVSAGAVAEAHFSIRGSIQDDEHSGFEVDFGHSVAVAAGAGYSLFSNVGINNPKRFFLYASERTTQEIVSYARRTLDERFYPLLEILQFTLPVVLNTAYELGQQEFDAGIQPDDITKIVTDNILSQLQRFLLDKMVEGAMNFLGTEIKRQIDQLIDDNNLPADTDSLKTALEALLATIKDDGISADNLDEITDRCIELIGTLDVVTENQRTAIAVAWLAFHTVEAIRTGISNASYSGQASAWGLAKQIASGVFIQLPTPPQMVQDEINRVTGLDGANISTSVAIDYILQSDVVVNMLAGVPPLQIFLEKMQEHLQLTPGEILQALYQTTMNDSFVQSDLYIRLKGLLRDLTDNFIHQQLIPEIKNQVAGDAVLIKYIDEVVSPSTKLLTGFIFLRVDECLDPDFDPTKSAAFNDSFFNALNKIVVKIFVTNVIVIADVLVEHALNNLYAGLNNLATLIESDQLDTMTEGLGHVLKVLVPGPLESLLDEAATAEATRQLAADLSRAGAQGWGPEVFTNDRKDRMRRLSRQLLYALDPDMDEAALANPEPFLAEVGKCYYIPDIEAAINIALLQLEIIDAALQIMTPLVADALSKFGRAISSAVVQKVENDLAAKRDEVMQFLAEAAVMLQRILDAIEDYAGLQLAAADAATQTMQALGNTIKTDTATRDAIKAAIYNFGLAKTDTSNGIAVAGYDAAFALCEPLINFIMDVLGDGMSGTASYLNNSLDIPATASKVADKALGDITALVADFIGVLPSPLPAALSPGDILIACGIAIGQTDPIRTMLAGAMQSMEDAKNFERDKQLKEKERDEFAAHQSAAEVQNEAFLLQHISIEIESPLPFVLHQTGKMLDWSYGKAVPVRIIVTGVNTTFIEAGPQRIVITFNGRSFAYSAADWHVSPNGKQLVFERTLMAGENNLSAGINVIECTIANGGGEAAIVRKKAAFMMSPALSSSSAVVTDIARSTLNTSGDDHGQAALESVAFTNQGNMPANMTGWILSDSKNHTFILPPFELMPQQTVNIYTGKGVNSGSAIYQNKTRAIWNNTGDRILLVNEKKVLVHTETYGYV